VPGPGTWTSLPGRERRRVNLPCTPRESGCRAPSAAHRLVPSSGHRPSTDEAEDRVRQLRGHGPSADSFTLRKPYPAPGQAAADVRSSDDWLCPA